MAAPNKSYGIRRAFVQTFASDNIVLVQALGICPIIAAGVSLQRAVALTVCTLVAMIPCSLLMSTIGKKISNLWRAPIYVLLAMAFMVGCGYVLTTYISPELYAYLYLFLPLMSVNSLFTYHGAGFSSGRSPLLALVDAIGTSLGFGLVICIVSTLRELAIGGTIWGVPVGFEARFPEATYPFAAFILLGFMAATLQQLKKKYLRGSQEEVLIGE